jgi:mutator family transposase/EF hand domain-containing protein
MTEITASPLNNVITIDDERIKNHLDRVVRGSVEETLNALLEAEADRLCNAQRYERSEARRDTRAGHSSWRERPGWGRGGMGMMGRGGAMGPGSPHGGMMMRMLFTMMDSDGDGTVSLQEFQAAHERIFKAMDANKDGRLTVDEVQAFMRGSGRAARQQQSP